MARNSRKDDSALEARCVPAHDDFSRGESLSPDPWLTSVLRVCPGPGSLLNPIASSLGASCGTPVLKPHPKHLSHGQTIERKGKETGLLLPEPS